MVFAVPCPRLMAFSLSIYFWLYLSNSKSNQLEFLFSILNKNQLYKNLAEIDDKDLTVDEKTKHLNNDFYHE
jgi:hypothetical protein